MSIFYLWLAGVVLMGATSIYHGWAQEKKINWKDRDEVFGYIVIVFIPVFNLIAFVYYYWLAADEG